MTANRFFVKQSQIQASHVFLEKEEHLHLSRVARIKPKEHIWLFDEKGFSYLAKVEEISSEATKLTILKREAPEKPPIKIALAQALLKAKKMDWVLQKATEFGIQTFLPLITSRSIVKIEGKAEKRKERWKKIAQESLKQCGRSFMPAVLSPLSLKRLVIERNEEEKIFLSERGGTPLRNFIEYQDAERKNARKKPPSSLILLVGPEGGWSQEEEILMSQHGYKPVSLGKYILKAESAAVGSLAILSHFWDL